MTDPHNTPVLVDGTLQLRAPVEGDAEARVALGRSKEVMHMFGAAYDPNDPYTLDMAKSWIESFAVEPNRFCIEHDGALIGWVWLHLLSVADRNTTLAIGIMDETKLGQGLGSLAMKLVLQHAFDTLGLHRVALRALAYNTRAIAAYEKLGFRHEGVLRDNAWVAGAWHDDVMMGLLASEYRK